MIIPSTFGVGRTIRTQIALVIVHIKYIQSTPNISRAGKLLFHAVTGRVPETVTFCIMKTNINIRRSNFSRVNLFQ